jgi:hypothetical protein
MDMPAVEAVGAGIEQVVLGQDPEVGRVRGR